MVKLKLVKYCSSQSKVDDERQSKQDNSEVSWNDITVTPVYPTSAVSCPQSITRTQLCSEAYITASL